MSVPALTDLTSLGAAGIMGAMWLWERRNSRQRDEQLTDSHNRILRDEQRLASLIQVVETNTQAFTRFNQTQEQVQQALSDVREEIRNGR